MGLSRTVSEIDGDISRKSQKFPTPLYFASPLKGFPFELGIGTRSKKKLEWRSYWLRKKFDDIFSRLDTIHQHDGQTYGQTTCDSKDRAYA